MTNQKPVSTHLAVPVPLDAVEFVPLHVIAALQDHILTQDGVRGERGPGEADGGDQETWNTSEVSYTLLVMT